MTFYLSIFSTIYKKSLENSFLATVQIPQITNFKQPQVFHSNFRFQERVG